MPERRSRWIVATAVVLLALGLASCVGRVTYSAVFPARGEDPITDELPVNLIDLTGLVRGVTVVSDAAFDWTPGVSFIGTDLRVTWVGGACESRVGLTFTGSGDGYALRIDPEQSLGGMFGCPAVGVGRVVRIQLAESIADQAVVLTLVPS